MNNLIIGSTIAIIVIIMLVIYATREPMRSAPFMESLVNGNVPADKQSDISRTME